MMWLARVSAYKKTRTRLNTTVVPTPCKECWPFYLQHVACLLAPDRDVIGLVQQLVRRVGLVQMRDQLRLQVVLDEVD